MLNLLPSSTIPVATDNEADVNTLFSPCRSHGQSLFTQLNIDEVGTDDQPLRPSLKHQVVRPPVHRLGSGLSLLAG